MLVKVIKPTSHRQQWRFFWLQWHLYLGLFAGLIFMLAGLTGSLLVFYVELDELLHPELQISSVHPPDPLPYEQIFQALQQHHPERHKAWRLEIPRHTEAMLSARYYKPDETEHLHFAPLMATINPYTAEVTSSRIWGEYLLTWIYDLHYTLLLDLTGKTLMGCLGGILLISLATGIYLWWPAPGKLTTALTIKAGASRVRLNYDIHKISGVYSLVLLLLLLISGILLELPDFFNPLINRLSPLYVTPRVNSVPHAGVARIPLDQAVRIAQQQFPQGQLRWIETPQDVYGSYRIIFYQAGEPSQRFPKSTVWIEQYSGQVLAARNPLTANSAGDTFITWLHPLHSGEIVGLTGRWLVLFSGLVPAILYITGFMRWRQKSQAKHRKLQRHD